MFRSTPSPTSPRTVNPPLPASSGPSQTHRTPTSHPATPLQTWSELLANGTEPGQQGPVLISGAAFAAGTLKKPLPISLDHEWLGKQDGKLSKDGDALLRSFVMAFKHGSPAAGNTFVIQKSASAVEVGFTHEGQQYNAKCHVKRDGNISDIEIKSTDTPPHQLSLTREGDMRRGDPAYFPSKRKASSASPLHRQLHAEAKRLKLEQDADDQLSSEIRAAYDVLRLAPDGGAIDLADVSSVLQVGGKKQLAALKVLMEAEKIDLEPENEHDTSVLSELVEYLAQPHRPNLSKFMEGQEDENMPTDRKRLALLKDMNSLGRCSNGQSPIDFAARNGMTYAFEVFSNSSNPKTQELLAASANPEVQQQLRLANINTSVAPTLLQFKQHERIENEYEYDTDAPFSSSRDFCEGVRNLGYVSRERVGLQGSGNFRDGSINIEEAIKHFKKAASGESIPAHASEDKLRIQLESYRNLILIHKNNELKMESGPQQEALMQTIREAHHFVSTLQSLPADQPSRMKIAQVYGAIMEQWNHVSSDEKQNVFLPQILEQMEKNDIFLDATEVAFHRALFEPVVLQGADPDVKARLIQALKNAKVLNADYEPKGDDDYFTLKAAQDFLEKVEVAEWKNTQAKDNLTDILNGIKTRLFSDEQETLEYFDLFVHAQDPAAKGEVAKAFVERAQEKNIDLNLGMESHSAMPAKAIFSSFSFASMHAYYLLSPEKEAGSLQNLSRGYGFGDPAVPVALQQTQLRLSDCTGAVRYFDPADYLSKWTKYTDHDRRLMIDLALESISLKAKLTSKEAVEALKKGEDERTCKAIDDWSSKARLWIKESDETASRSAEYRALRQRIAAHSRDELARTE